MQTESSTTQQLTVKHDTHYTRVHGPCRNDARVHGPWTRVSFLAPLSTGCLHDPWTRVSFWTPVITGRGHVRHFVTARAHGYSVYQTLVTSTYLCRMFHVAALWHNKW